jgi:hypothetical protein
MLPGYPTTCDDDKPHLITNVLTTNATRQDFDALPDIHQALEERDCGPLLANSRIDYGIDLIGPVVEKHFWQYQTGFEIDAFTIDWQNHVVTCPRGKVNYPWTMRTFVRWEL